MPREGAGVQQPVLFLLENPGGDYKKGVKTDFLGYRKQPPVNHYYWTPNTAHWPRDKSEFKGNFYGPYFAYLMCRHQLMNVYITNAAKCKWTHGKTPSSILKNCVRNYLRREIELFQPRLVFCFGRAAERVFRSMVCNLQFSYLYHPSFIQSRFRVTGRTQQQLLEENDTRICDAIASLA